MTTEEFEGHLMAVLHGPTGRAIAGRVLLLALDDETAAQSFAELLATSTGNLYEEVFNLQVRAHVDDAIKHPPKGSNPVQWAVDLASVRRAVMGVIREQLRARLSEESGRALAERIGLDLESPEDGP